MFHRNTKAADLQDLRRRGGSSTDAIAAPLIARRSYLKAAPAGAARARSLRVREALSKRRGALARPSAERMIPSVLGSTMLRMTDEGRPEPPLPDPDYLTRGAPAPPPPAPIPEPEPQPDPTPEQQ